MAVSGINDPTRPCAVGNALVVLSDPAVSFSDRQTPGSLEFSNERHRPAFFPLTSKRILTHREAVWQGPRMPTLWRTGRSVGRVDAPGKHSPQTFRSLTPEEWERGATVPEA